jgi:hypothetical protein
VGVELVGYLSQYHVFDGTPGVTRSQWGRSPCPSPMFLMELTGVELVGHLALSCPLCFTKILELVGVGHLFGAVHDRLQMKRGYARYGYEFGWFLDFPDITRLHTIMS